MLADLEKWPPTGGFSGLRSFLVFRCVADIKIEHHVQGDRDKDACDDLAAQVKSSF
jgi:hypothetical protein